MGEGDEEGEKIMFHLFYSMFMYQPGLPLLVGRS